MSFLDAVNGATTFLEALNTNLPAFNNNVGSLVETLQSANVKKSSLVEFLQPGLADEQKRTTSEGLATTLSSVRGSKQESFNVLPKSGLTAVNELLNNLANKETRKGALALQGGVSGMVKGSIKMMALNAAMTVLGSALRPFESITGTLSTLGSLFGMVFQPLVNDINKGLMQAAPYIIKFTKWTSGLYKDLKSWMSNLSFTGILQFFKNMGKWIKDKIVEGWGVFSDWVVGIGQSIKDKAIEGWVVVTDWASGIGNSIKNAFVSGWSTVTDWASGIGNSIKNAFVSGWSTVTTWFGTVGESIKNKIIEGWVTVTTWFGTIGTNIVNVITIAWVTVTNWFGNIGSGIVTVLTTAWVTVTDWFGGLFSGIKTILETGWTVVTNWFASIPQLILTAITTSGTNIVTGIQDWWKNIWEREK